jgi:hypothetical protein
MLTPYWMKDAWHRFHPCASYIRRVDEIQEAIVVQLELTEEIETQDRALLLRYLDSCVARLNEVA